MPAAPIEDVGFQTILLVFASLLAVLVILFLLLWVGWKKEGVRGNKCPYCRRPMRLGIDVATSIAEMVNALLNLGVGLTVTFTSSVAGAVQPFAVSVYT